VMRVRGNSRSGPFPERVSAFPSAGIGPDRELRRTRAGSSGLHDHRGFTLIEVLAALVIVALGMIAAIQAVTQSARNGVYLRDKTLAHWIGMNVLTERRLQSAPPDVAESTGRVEYAGQLWQWSMKVTQTQVSSLRRMDIIVRRADAPEGTSLATVSGFYGTAIGGAGKGGQLQWAGAGAPGTDGEAPAEDKEDEETDQNRNGGGGFMTPPPGGEQPVVPPEMQPEEE
jgi:general secretion pathway protein I